MLSFWNLKPRLDFQRFAIQKKDFHFGFDRKRVMLPPKPVNFVLNANWTSSMVAMAKVGIAVAALVQNNVVDTSAVTAY